MNAFDISCFRDHLKINDPENRELRRTLHENYEWLDGYWRPKWEKDGNNAIFRFCDVFGEYYWHNVPNIQELANELGKLGPIENSTKPGYKATPQIIKATFLLKSTDGTPVERFRAMMELVKQIRNNLFHGKKMELNKHDVYERNKTLIRLGAEITTVVLDRLGQAERDLG